MPLHNFKILPVTVKPSFLKTLKLVKHINEIGLDTEVFKIQDNIIIGVDYINTILSRIFILKEISKNIIYIKK